MGYSYGRDKGSEMTQPIDRETAIALAKEAGKDTDFTKHIELWTPDTWRFTERLCNLAVAHSRKDAEPVAWIYIEKQGRVLSFTPPTSFDKQELSEGEIGIEALYLHPPEADKLLQQALEAVLDEHLPGFTEDAPRQHDDVIYDKAIEDAADAIQQLIARTYLEGKK